MLLKSFISAVFMLSFMFASAQDSTINKKKSVAITHKYRNIRAPHPKKKIIYRDTRLGSSSPMYNTYKKNDKGAGAITTNPNKGGGGSAPVMVAENPKDSVYRH
ncbi:MAG: hypothetical protein ACMG51_09590 [Ginsengibacter sp.]